MGEDVAMEHEEDGEEDSDEMDGDEEDDEDTIMGEVE